MSIRAMKYAPSTVTGRFSAPSRVLENMAPAATTEMTAIAENAGSRACSSVYPTPQTAPDR